MGSDKGMTTRAHGIGTPEVYLGKTHKNIGLG
jgi:hypothetical protein